MYMDTVNNDVQFSTNEEKKKTSIHLQDSLEKRRKYDRGSPLFHR